MYTLYYRRDEETTKYVTDDLRTACIICYNETTYLGAETAYIIDSETGELLRHYKNR